MAQTSFTPQNPSINNEDVEQQPLLANPELQIEGNHNDPELSIQKTVYNLNNRNVRITLWCIIYMIFTTASIQNGTSQYIYVTEDWDTDTYNPDTWQKRHLTTFYSLLTSSSSILWWAAAILILNLYCVLCKCQCSPVVALFFIAGGTMQAVTCYDGIYLDCRSDDSDSDKADIGYCKVGYIALYLWIVLFPFYLAMDTMFSIGDNIRTRIFVKSFIICIRSFLIFLIVNYNLQQLIKEEKNDTDWNPPYDDHSEKFDYRSGMSYNFSLFFWCLVLMIIVGMGYGNKDASNKRLNIWVKRIIGWFIIGSTGGALATGVYYHYGGVDLYWLSGSVLLVYDLQYL